MKKLCSRCRNYRIHRGKEPYCVECMEALYAKGRRKKLNSKTNMATFFLEEEPKEETPVEESVEETPEENTGEPDTAL